MPTEPLQETNNGTPQISASPGISEQDLLVDGNKKYYLPFKYWVPTLISVVAGTTALIWFFISAILNPIKNDILELKTTGSGNSGNSPLIINTVFLEATDGKDISDNQLLQIKNVLFKLNQRKDLVLFVAGYTDDNLQKDQFQKVLDSKAASERIRNIFIKQGIEANRIYYDGFGQDVPKNFNKLHRNNVALLVINVYELMKQISLGGSINQAV